MSLPRFYFPQLTRTPDSSPSLCQLSGPEAKHATAVLRLGEGDQLELFNGRGDCATAKILARRKDLLDLECTRWYEPDQPQAVDLTVLIALPKGDRQRVLIDAVTELGVARLVPLRTQRGVAQPTDSALERLERTVIEACKQCGRNRLMEIGNPLSLMELNHEPSPTQETLAIVAHPYSGAYATQPLKSALRTQPRAVRLVIGPEGGLTDAEVDQLAKTGWQVVTLGNTILRIEVAAISAVAQILA